jgi:hypothetical protein
MKNVIKNPLKKFPKLAVAILCVVLVGFLLNCSKLQRFDFDGIGNTIDAIKTAEECNCKNKLYRYYHGEKQMLDSLLLNDYLIVGFDEQVQGAVMVDYIAQIGLFYPLDTSKIIPLAGKDYSLFSVKTNEPKTCLQLKETICLLEQSSLVVFADHVFRGDTCVGLASCFDAFTTTEEFLVRVKDTNDLSDLYTVMQETNTQIKGQSI